MRKKPNKFKRFLYTIFIVYILFYLLINFQILSVNINDNNINKYFPTFKYTFDKFNDEKTKTSNFDLSSLYDDVVSDIYPNENLKKIKVEWADLTNDNASGLFKYSSNTEAIIYINYDMINRPEQDLRDVLAHEIIHYYLFSKNINDNHDKPFKDEMRRINNLGKGYNISIIDFN